LLVIYPDISEILLEVIGSFTKFASNLHYDISFTKFASNLHHDISEILLEVIGSFTKFMDRELEIGYMGKCIEIFSPSTE
jgi:hypothetical protein